ncbi:hypothetical protein [Nonomuraea jabiensis]|uniref:hypothetical protein n=1 Tax=Nonomuraea jabiensis TaxID=882448 RepID=UPI003D721176
MYEWKPYIPETYWRVVEASCCEEFRLCHSSDSYFVLRRTPAHHDEETGRGPYLYTLGVWQQLAAQHRHQADAAEIRQRRTGLRFRWPGGVVSRNIGVRGRPAQLSQSLSAKSRWPATTVVRWARRERVA